MKQPKISLITVTFNSDATLEDTIQSVLNQNFKDIEYIIVDGSSTDKTLEIIRRYSQSLSIKWISEPDRGLYDAMNKGINMATGEVIGFINSDDVFCATDALSTVAETFQSYPDLDSAYADINYVANQDITKIVRKWKTGNQRSFVSGWHPAHPTFYVKRSVYEKYGGFDLNFKLAADFELMLRFLEKYKITTKYINRSLISMRLGGVTNRSLKNIANQNKECIRAFKHNGIAVNYFYPFIRLSSKIKQYFH